MVFVMVFPEYGKAESGDTMSGKLIQHGFAFEKAECYRACHHFPGNPDSKFTL